jgi:integrase
MALQMTRPTKHHRTGIYHVRLAVPPPLRETAKGLFGAGWELIETLGTKDPCRAKDIAPAALERLKAKMEAVKAAHAGTPQRVPEQAIQALAGQFYREQMDRWGADPGPVGRWEGEQFGILDAAEHGPEDDRLPMDEGNHQLLPVATEADRVIASRLLQDAGYSPTTEAVERLAPTVVLAQFQFAQAMERRSLGDWRKDKTPKGFPPLPVRATPAAPIPAPAPITSKAGPTLDDLLRGWARDEGHSLDAKPIGRPLYDRQQTMKRLVEFLGHQDASTITKADAVRWKETMQEKKRSPATIRNDLSEMSAIWKNAIRNARVPEGSNPFAGISPPKPKTRKATRRPFTQEEAALILTAARGNTGYMRWVPWVCCLTGARLSEVCQSSRDDIAEVDGVTMLLIHDEGDDGEVGVRSIKNPISRRSVPIHPALIAEGFLDYVNGLSAGAALFPDAEPDALFGRRGTNVSRVVSRWLRGTLKVTDMKISPNHSWRHWFTDACRRTSMNLEVRSALTGHSAGLDESARYGTGAGALAALLLEAISKVVPPVPPLQVAGN